MAKPTTYVGSNVALFLEGTPSGTFLRPCGLTSHTITFSKNTQDVTVPDCNDLEAAAWIERGVESLDMSGSGSGILAAEAVDLWWDAFRSNESINSRVYVGAANDTANGHYWAGNIHLTQFEVSGERGGKAQVNVSFVSDGEVTYHDVAAP
ncbi:phage tail tube protein [Paracoccus sp. (in: a-proteobacteria)]|uniref:phage tail tube protein n=1 Tax=Paracoccus sp. TaxID=267 RepID=UPI00289A6B16|nr:phage tail tube protein [Paracoccus sp. (in: a-proteobacteria)]